MSVYVCSNVPNDTVARKSTRHSARRAVARSDPLRGPVLKRQPSHYSGTIMVPVPCSVKSSSRITCGTRPSRMWAAPVERSIA